MILGPNEPTDISLIRPSEVTHFVAELGIIFLLFFLGLEFALPRLLRAGRHVVFGGALDLLLNAGVGLAIGVAAFGFSFAALILAAAIYVSSSAVIVKGLIDFRRLADDETDLILAILLFEDLVIGVVLGFAGGNDTGTLEIVAKALAFVTASLAASRWLPDLLDAFLARLPREFFLLTTVAFVVGLSALASWLGLSEAVGALMAGVILSGTSLREEIEERFFSFRDLFGALFFFVFGLSIDVGSLGRVGWLLTAAVAAAVVAKTGAGFLAGVLGGFTRRQSLNAGIALIAHGEFTIIVAQIASGNERIPASVRSDLVAFAGLYVLVTASLGVILMRESKTIGRKLYRGTTLAEGS
jgi:CPA2 family monovalent cation:H+ antiporter-2